MLDDCRFVNGKLLYRKHTTYYNGRTSFPEEENTFVLLSVGQRETKQQQKQQPVVWALTFVLRGCSKEEVICSKC